MSDDVRARWLTQAGHFAGTPMYERIARTIADDPPVADLLLAAPPEQRLGIIVMAAVHYLLMLEPDERLARFYPSLGGRDDGDPYPAFRAFCLARADEVRTLCATRAIQTNEVRRCTYLVPALALAAARADGPTALVEVGASAGLNLNFQRYRLEYGARGSVGDPGSPVALATEVRGSFAPPVPGSMPEVGPVTGIDTNPVDLGDPDACAWLRACVWPEQVERRARLDAAIEVARAHPPRIVKGNAADVLPEVADESPGALCVMHTATLPYFTPDDEVRLRDAMVDASKERDVWWIAGEGVRRMAALWGIGTPVFDDAYGVHLARLRDGAFVEAAFLARAQFHGAWLEWAA